jgi:hypothetical protein
MELNDCLKRVRMDLILKHRQAARDKDEPLREKLFNMISELEAIYPHLSDW